MLTIGQLAVATHVSADTIRYYESVGVLPAPARSSAGYRLYPPTEVRRLQLVKQAKLLGLSLPEVREFVAHTFTDSCAHLQQTLLDRIPAQVADIEARIASLTVLKDELVTLQAHLERLEGTLPGDPVIACEQCPCVAGTERSNP